MDNLKRFTVCKLARHEWVKISYPHGADGERAGIFLRCGRVWLTERRAAQKKARARGGVSAL